MDENDNPVTRVDDLFSVGTLSERMLVPGNMWQEAWEGCKPIPARRQKRLFNDTKEAEKVGYVAIHPICIIHQGLFNLSLMVK